MKRRGKKKVTIFASFISLDDHFDGDPKKCPRYVCVGWGGGDGGGGLPFEIFVKYRQRNGG